MRKFPFYYEMVTLYFDDATLSDVDKLLQDQYNFPNLSNNYKTQSHKQVKKKIRNALSLVQCAQRIWEVGQVINTFCQSFFR